MKPFDLEKALAGEPVVTRDGRPVQEIHHLTTCESVYPVVCVIDGAMRAFTIEGVFYTGDGHESSDLFMASTKREGWVNLYPPMLHTNIKRLADCQHVWPTQEEALDRARVNAVATVRVEWEE